MKFKNSKKYKCIVLVARSHGLETIKKLLESDFFEIIAIFTHKLNPKSYDPQQNERIDFHYFSEFAKNNNIDFNAIDKIDEKIILEEFASNINYDFLISVSWRYLISAQVFEKAKIGAINLHRGDLPKYAGIEPIKRALENLDNNIIISCHHITKNFDEGKVICKSSHPANYDQRKSLSENVERLKVEITDYFPTLTIKSLKFLIQDELDGK